jgi:hypothetical protein
MPQAIPLSEMFDADMGLVWVQPGGPNTTCYPVWCANSDGLTEPQGDVTSRMVRTQSGWKTVMRSQGLPGDATMSLEVYLTKSMSWLQKLLKDRCPFPVYVHLGSCPPSNEFLMYDYGKVGAAGVITNRGTSGVTRGKADGGEAAAAPTLETYDISVAPSPNEYWHLIFSARTLTGEVEPGRDIEFCTIPQCRGNCGPQTYLCDSGIAVVDSAPAAALSTPWLTADGWVTAAGAAADPFIAAMDIAAVTCFKIDRDHTRLMVGRGTTDAGKADVSYSDDGGLTWTGVEIVPSTAGEFFAHGGGLFSLDSTHIWAFTNLCNIFFSSDGGLTWVDQNAPAPVGAETGKCIHFVDSHYGYAVGGAAVPTQYIAYTTDGGEHWQLPATEPAIQNATGVKVLDSNRVWVTMANGTLYFTNNFGATWTQRVLPVLATNLGDVDFWDEFAGAVCGVRTVGGNVFPIVYRTFNGGMNWEYYQYTTDLDGVVQYYGMNSVKMCGYNKIFTFGEIVDSVPCLLMLLNNEPSA